MKGGGRIAEWRTQQKKLRYQWRELFTEFDTDNNGHLDRDEFRLCLTMLGFKGFTEAELDAVLAKVDKDSNGTIVQAEFESMIKALSDRMNEKR